MRRASTSPRVLSREFRRVVRVALTLPEVELTTRHDGSPVLKLRGCFMARPALHPSADADSVVVRADPDTRALWLADAPDAYYVTEYYGRHPVVLVRIARLDVLSLRDVLATSWRLTALKARPARAGRCADRGRFVTGRSAPTLVETHGRVTTLGCDHRRDDEVMATFDRIGDTVDTIDILVNAVWGGYDDMTEDGRLRPSRSSQVEPAVVRACHQRESRTVRFVRTWHPRRP